LGGWFGKKQNKKWVWGIDGNNHGNRYILSKFLMMMFYKIFLVSYILPGLMVYFVD
jgi:hypothetical protein